ncbi:hypothetical protein [uncultured Flavobacterium sp.]|uniref:hypothetical protein n=1 Tax=uncultured Flavobacterium sp. TaxID=165435 RepID=UPI00292CC4BD|nr:hypothetical protein [uncultured Flavobacterium sp.]
MKHQEYLLIVEEKTSSLNQENLLFWDLWCLNYVYEKISNKEYQYYNDIKKSYFLLWDYHDKIITDINSLLQDESVKIILNFDNDDFEDLDEFDTEERAIQEMITGLESIFLNLKEEYEVIYNAYENPINVIDVEIEGILISKDNEDSIYLNEVKAQITLLDDLNSNIIDYKVKDRNIYR